MRRFWRKETRAGKQRQSFRLRVNRTVLIMLALNIAIIGKVFADLADVRRWLAWRTETRSGRTTKVLMIGSQGPIKHASSTDPRTWHDLATVRAALANGHRLDGPGIVLGQLEDGRWLVGVDLDPCRSPPSGEVVAWTRRIMTRLGTYAEVSPSGLESGHGPLRCATVAQVAAAYHQLVAVE